MTTRELRPSDIPQDFLNATRNDITGLTGLYSLAGGDLIIGPTAYTSSIAAASGLYKNSHGIDVSGAAPSNNQFSGGSAGHTICWKTATTLSYCTSLVASDGTCTCN